MLTSHASVRKISGVLLFAMLFATLFSCAKQNSGCTSPVEAAEKCIYALEGKNANDLAILLSPNFIKALTKGKPREILSVLQETFDNRIDRDIIAIENMWEYAGSYDRERLKNAWGHELDKNVTELVRVHYDLTTKEKGAAEENGPWPGVIYCGKIGEYWYVVARG